MDPIQFYTQGEYKQCRCCGMSDWCIDSQCLACTNNYGFHSGVTTYKQKPYFSTYNGHKFVPDDLENVDFDIRDIAHSLSIVRRYLGHTRVGYSSGQHSLMVAKYIPWPFKLRGLMHDASDAYVGDMPSPLKHHPLMEGFRKYEKEVQNKIYQKFGLDIEMSPQAEHELRKWDLAALAAEARCLTNLDWWKNVPGSDLITEKVEPLPDQDVEHLFLREFDKAYKEFL